MKNYVNNKKTSWNRKWKTPEDLRRNIDIYFEDCEKRGRPLTITGLTLALETSRQTLLEYEGQVKGREEKSMPRL